VDDIDRPVLAGARVTIRPGRPEDVDVLRAMLAEESVARWWGEPAPRAGLAADLLGRGEGDGASGGESHGASGDGDGSDVLLVVEVDGVAAGGIQYHEETDPMYRHAGIDIFLGRRWQGRGLGSEAVWLLARYLVEERGHHRLTIDPAASNEAAIRSYAKVGFRPVGLLRRYERGPDGTYHDGLLMDLLAEELTRP
jgi:aminoglycoside 6'-N-acetyltransferase